MTDDSQDTSHIPIDTSRTKKTLKKIGAGVARLAKTKQKFPMPNPESGLKVIIATDAWKPQVNGVVTTLDTLGQILTGFGNQVVYITPQDFKSIPMPTYPEIRLSLFPNRKVAKIINEFQPRRDSTSRPKALLAVRPVAFAAAVIIPIRHRFIRALLNTRMSVLKCR